MHACTVTTENPLELLNKLHVGTSHPLKTLVLVPVKQFALLGVGPIYSNLGHGTTGRQSHLLHEPGWRITAEILQNRSLGHRGGDSAECLQEGSGLRPVFTDPQACRRTGDLRTIAL